MSAPEVRPENVEQVKELLNFFATTPLNIPEHACTNACRGVRCLRPLVLGTLNTPRSWSGDDALWGPEAAGSLFADFDYRSEMLVGLWGSFPAPPGEAPYTEDYSFLLAREPESTK